MGKNVVKRNLKVDGVEFELQIYLRLETKGHTNGQYPAFEIFPKDYHAALYAFSNKDELNKLIKEKYIEESRKK